MTRAVRSLALGILLVGLGLNLIVAQEVRLRPLKPIYLDAQGNALNAPESVAYDGQSTLIVADTGNRRFLVYTVTEESVTPVSEIRVAQVPYPIHVRIDSSGDLLALDGKSHRIARIGRDGTFKSYLDIQPKDGAKQAMIRSFDLGGDQVYALDVAAARIVVLDAAGAEVREIAFAADTGFLSDLTADDSGNVFAVDSLRRMVFAAKRGETELTPLSEPMPEAMTLPVAIAVDAVGRLYLADRTGSGIVIVGRNGTFGGRQSRMGWTQGFLRYPTGLAAGNGYLFVADRGNNRVQRFEIVE